MSKIITETQLIIPALTVLSFQEDVISTKQLKAGIIKLIKPKKADLVNVTNRDQSIFDSRIDNLISHRTLESLVDHAKIGGKMYIKINGRGRTFISKKLLEAAAL